MLEPLALARLVQAAEIRPDDSVLHVACNSGYGTALLARLAARVRAVEEDAGLAAAARTNFAALGVDAAVTEGPLAAGLPQEGPFDVILVEGAVARLPDTFAAQLKDDGRLVTIVNDGGTGQGHLFRRAGDHLSGFPRFTATAPVLPGFARPAEFVF
jgi:protein-L-isoaspartate(D-aspartate) O-methyltransferase